MKRSDTTSAHRKKARSRHEQDAASLAGQGKYEDAERLLLEGYERMEPPAIRATRKRQALVRLVEFYEDWDKPDPAARWRKC